MNNDDISEQAESVQETTKNTPTHGETGGWGAYVWETVKVVVTSLAIILPIRYYLIQPFFVNGASMEPNFHDKDYIMVDKLGYRLNDPKRGDVIVFQYPQDPREYFIKRIIGLPGETVQIKDDTVTVFNDEYPEGLLLDEDIYLPDTITTRDNMRLKLNTDEYFVMGDNREHSSDSRRWGPLKVSFIAGRALVRLYPFDDVLKIPRVSY